MGHAVLASAVAPSIISDVSSVSGTGTGTGTSTMWSSSTSSSSSCLLSLGTGSAQVPSSKRFYRALGFPESSSTTRASAGSHLPPNLFSACSSVKFTGRTVWATVNNSSSRSGSSSSCRLCPCFAESHESSGVAVATAVEERDSRAQEDSTRTEESTLQIEEGNRDFGGSYDDGDVDGDGATGDHQPWGGNGKESDTAGAVLQVEALTLSAGGRDLIREGEWRLMAGEHAGIVGVNGSGKSTLLRAVVGVSDVQSGVIRVAPGTEVAYLEQTAVSGSTRTVWEEAGSRMLAFKAAMRELAAAENAVENAEEEDVSSAINKLGNAQDRVEALDGYRMDEVIAGVLNGLGFDSSDWERSCSEFSGGWQMRIALARLLLGQKGHIRRSLLVLDEPTNHLDVKAKKWLASYLKGVSAAVAVVSHDQAFLESVCDRIVEIRGQQLHHYTGRYSKFLRTREAQQLQALQAYQAQQAEITRLEGFVNRFGAKATKAAAANSKKKQIERIKQQMPDSVPASLSGLGEAGGDKTHISVKLPKPSPCSRDAVSLKKASIGWTGCDPLMHDVNLLLTIGMRVVILGPNGCGKSSLMKAMAGGETLQRGTRLVGDRVEIGVFTQDLAQDLPGHLSGLDFVLQVAREKNSFITDGQARTALGALGLTGDAALRPISLLSGGEKARVALGVFMLRPYNCLLLDEASNHLDHLSAVALAKGLSNFEGALVAISHDQKFCEALNPTHIARVEDDGSVTMRNAIFGNVEMASSSSSQPGNKGNSSGNASLKVDTRNKDLTNEAFGKATKKSSSYHEKKLSQQLQEQIKRKLLDIEELEAAGELMDAEMAAAGSNASQAMEIYTRKEKIIQKLQLAESQWEALEKEVQDLNKRLSI